MDENPRVPELAAEGKATKVAGIVGNASEDRNVAVDADRDAVVPHRRQPKRSGSDLAKVVRLGPKRSESRDFDELGGRHARQCSGIGLQQGLPTCRLERPHLVLGTRAGALLLGSEESRVEAQQQGDSREAAASAMGRDSW